jgi:hypothetical protein
VLRFIEDEERGKGKVVRPGLAVEEKDRES